MTRLVQHWKQRARQLRTEVYAVYVAYRDPRVPWHARLFAACVVGYAFSPIDLIPDPIPILGYVDDLILIPLGIKLALAMIPTEVMAESRESRKSAGHHPSGQTGQSSRRCCHCGDLVCVGGCDHRRYGASFQGLITCTATQRVELTRLAYHAAQHAHAADRLPRRVLRCLALVSRLWAEYTCRQSCLACCSSGFSIAPCLPYRLARHGGG